MQQENHPSQHISFKLTKRIIRTYTNRRPKNLELCEANKQLNSKRDHSDFQAKQLFRPQNQLNASRNILTGLKRRLRS